MRKFSTDKLLASLLLVASVSGFALLPTVAGTGTPTKQTTFQNAVIVKGAFTAEGASTFSGAITNSGVNTLTGANVITHAPTGLKIQDSDASHLVTIAPGNESANRTLSIPVLGGADTISTLGTAQTVTGVKTMSGANVIRVANTGLTLNDTAGDHTTQLKQNSDEAANRTLNIPALGGNDTLMTLGTAQTITGVKTFTPAIAKASVNIGVRQKDYNFSPNSGGTLADGTTYTQYFAPGRAGVVTKVSLVGTTPPVGGTNTVDVKKGGSGGQSVLSAAFDPTTLVADTISAATLNGTPANLAFTATQGLKVTWVAGTQSTDAVGCGVTIEVEFDDQ